MTNDPKAERGVCTSCKLVTVERIGTTTVSGNPAYHCTNCTHQYIWPGGEPWDTQPFETRETASAEVKRLRAVLEDAAHALDIIHAETHNGTALVAAAEIRRHLAP